MCAPPLPTLGSFFFLCLHQSCYGDTLKVVNPVSLHCDTYLKKKHIFFHVFTFKASQMDYINGFKASISRSKGQK
jgi:hypothetical protein